METERRRSDIRNQNQFRRPFNPPQFLQRERRNKDQVIQASIKMKIGLNILKKIRLRILMRKLI
jgi:hypothetical protein